MKRTEIIREIFDAFPSPVFVVDRDVKVLELNAAAEELMVAERNGSFKQMAGEVLHCIHSYETPEGCGQGPFCKYCIVRNSVNEAFQGRRVVRRQAKIEILRDNKSIPIYALITVSPFTFEDNPLLLLIIEDISEIVDLYRMIPVCSVCGKVRDDKETWMRIEKYFKEKWGIDFTHGLCPDCFKTEMEKMNSQTSTLAEECMTNPTLY